MATNGSLNDMEQWRSVVEYQRRKCNPESTFQNRFDVPAYLDEWDDEIHTDTRGPYQSAENARRQAGRDAAGHDKQTHGGWGPNPVMSVARVVRTYIERASLAWEPFDERNTETGKWGG